jgi:predicted Zn-dependent protease with MMP-like domain
MYTVSREQFESLVNEGIEALPILYRERMENVAIIAEDQPSPQQRERLKLRGDQTLLGLYEGVPLSARGGQVKLLPDKITLFKIPLEASSNGLDELKENIRHTIWHETAHYFGLGHQRIHELE